MKIKSPVIFFDVGHTLVQGADPSMRRRLASRLQLSEKEAKRAGRLIMVHPATDPATLAEGLQAVLPARKPARIRRVVADLWEEQRNSVTAVPGVIPVLRSLKAMGTRLGIASNAWHPFHQGFATALEEILDLLDYTILSYRVGCKKPSRQFYRHLLSRVRVAEHDCWMVGDAYHHDIEPALHQGMRTVWLLKYPEREKGAIADMLRGSRPRPHWVVENLAEVVPFFREKTTFI